MLRYILVIGPTLFYLNRRASIKFAEEAPYNNRSITKIRDGDDSSANIDLRKYAY